VPCGIFTEKEEIERIFLGFTLEAQKQIPASFQRQRKKVIVIAGPTCAGKSELALELCQHIGGEIISGDSIQVYKGMDIGTAKPTSEEMALVPHHLIDIREVSEPFNVVDFYYDARHACQLILGKGKVPVIVGGSGFYIHSLLYGPPSGPPSVPELRRSLEEEMQKIGPDKLYERLYGLDAEYAKTITKHDKQKIIRALEILTLTRKPVSKLSWKSRHKALNYDFHCWFLHRPKEVLYHRINKRCEKMVEKGLVEEARGLITYGIEKNPSAAQAIGYRQALDFLKTAQTPADEAECMEAFKIASRHYAKRQMTWFKNKEPLFKWLDLDMHDPEVVIDLIEQDYGQGS
jgi:tRNA dimethylallyltransferase